MTDLILAGERLADVLERENAALAALALDGLAPLVAEKTAAVEGLIRAYGAVASVQETDRDPTPPALVALQRRLTALMGENRRLLLRGIAAQSGLVEMIARLLAGGEATAGYGTPAAPRHAAPIAVSARA